MIGTAAIRRPSNKKGKRVLLRHLTDDLSGQAPTSKKGWFAAELLSQLCDVASDEVQEGQGIEVLGLLVHLDATAGCKGT